MIKKRQEMIKKNQETLKKPLGNYKKKHQETIKKTLGNNKKPLCKDEKNIGKCLKIIRELLKKTIRKQ